MIPIDTVIDIISQKKQEIENSPEGRYHSEKSIGQLELCDELINELKNFKKLDS